ncbi:MAG: hypothetical protein ACOY90_11445 [Candidatus Zhuqueibacterota bacterium]
MGKGQKIVLEKIGQDGSIIKIRFTEPLSAKLAPAYLTAAFNKCFKNKFYKLILDMTNIDDPSQNFISTIIEATAKVRSKEGDVKIINVSPEADLMMSGFNAYAYLSVPKEKES